MYNCISIVFVAFMFVCNRHSIPVSTKTKADEKVSTVSKEKIATTDIINDTTAYIKDIKSNKKNYIDKDLGVLLKDLKIKPKSYSVGSSRRDEDIVPDISLYFVAKLIRLKKDALDTDYPIGLYIIFKNRVLQSDANAILLKSNDFGNWHKAEEEFYAKQIIADIR